LSTDSTAPRNGRTGLAVVAAGLTLFVFFQVFTGAGGVAKNAFLTAISIPSESQFPAPYIPLQEKGWNDAIVLLDDTGNVLSSGVPFQPGRHVGFALANTGPRSAENVFYRLGFDGRDIYSQSVPQMQPGEARVSTVNLDEVVHSNGVRSGRHRIELTVDPAKPAGTRVGSGSSFALDVDLAVARSPASRRAAQSPAEQAIQEMSGNSTWISSRNIAEVVAIAKEVLGNIPLDWSGMDFSVLPFNEYNARHGEVIGKTAAEKRRLAEQLEEYSLGGAGFHYFPSSHQRAHVILREGLLVQVLPIILREVGGIYAIQRTYGQKDYEWVFIGRASSSPEFDLAVFMAYGVRVLVEKFGWGYVTNVSYLNLRDSGGPGYLRAGETWDLWTAATDAGYAEGDVPSSFWLKLHTDILNMKNPAGYIDSVAARGQALDRERVARIVESRAVDKEHTIVPDTIRRKLDAAGRYSETLSLDRVLVNQMQYVMP